MRDLDSLQPDGWLIDLESRHAAHQSGLYAYFDPVSTPSGAIRCVGPISSLSVGLDPKQVQRHILSLTLELENILESDSIYCIWGGYTYQTQFQDHLMDILGLEHSFIPNTTLRSLLLLSSKTHDLAIHLQREWVLDLPGNRVVHANGLEFEFGPSLSKFRRWNCNVRRTGNTDATTMHPNLSSIVIGALSGIALSLLTSNVDQPSAFRNRDVSVSIGPNLFEWNPINRISQ